MNGLLNQDDQQELKPRVIRANQMPGYCGVSERVFESDFRPHLNEAKLGVQGVGFDRVEVDRFITWYFKRYSKRKAQGSKLWQREERPTLKASTLRVVSTSSTRSTKGTGFLNELAQVISKKR